MLLQPVVDDSCIWKFSDIQQILLIKATSRDLSSLGLLMKASSQDLSSLGYGNEVGNHGHQTNVISSGASACGRAAMGVAEDEEVDG